MTIVKIVVQKMAYPAVGQQVHAASHQENIGGHRHHNGHKHGAVCKPGSIQSYEEHADHCSTQYALHGVIPADFELLCAMPLLAAPLLSQKYMCAQAQGKKLVYTL